MIEEKLYPYRRSPDQDVASPARHQVVIVGAGPVGLAAAIDLGMHGISVIVLDDNDQISVGSRAICFSKRTLEIFDRLGCGDKMVGKGVTWNTGRVYWKDREIFNFNLLPESGHKRPAFINIQQYYVENYLFDRIQELRESGTPIEIRGRNKVIDIQQESDFVRLTMETPEGPYKLDADWVLACDGARSSARRILGQTFSGRIFEDNFLIADIVMKADFPVERRFWFDPPFNPGQSALLHKQPDNIWRVDFQLGWDIDREYETKPENVIARIKAMLGSEAEFELDWVSIYTFQCCQMDNFWHNRVIFAGDSAHQVSPFGARGCNGGIQDIDNLVWKLVHIIDGSAPTELLRSYEIERQFASQVNILNSTRSTDFITPKSEISLSFRDSVLQLASEVPFAKTLINSGRLSEPATYAHSPLNGPDDGVLPDRTCPGAPAVDADIGGSWLLDKLGFEFKLLAINCEIPEAINLKEKIIPVIEILSEDSEWINSRYLGDAKQAIYLFRPDQHIAARWTSFNRSAVDQALAYAVCQQSQE